MVLRLTSGSPPGPPPQEFTWNERRLVYESFGDGERVVVLIHGLLMDARLYRDVARLLAECGYRVILVELLGHGRSEKPTRASEYRMDVYAAQVVALLDHLGVQRAVVGGMSLGANVTLQLAAHHPERVQGMLLEMPVLERAVPVAALTFVPALVMVHYARSVARALRWVSTRVATGHDVIDGVLSPLRSPPEVTAAVLHGILVGPTVPTVEERRRITVPALVVGHGLDVIHPFSDAESLVRHLPGGRLVRARTIAELRVRPQRLLSEVDAFLTEVWSGRAGPVAVADAG